MRYKFYFVLFAFIALLVSSCVTDSDKPVWSLQKGDNLPGFSVIMNDGDVVTTGSLRGRKSMIVFFNTGCSDCRKELPAVQEVYDRCLRESNDVEIICISRSEGKESVERYWRKNGLTLPFSAQDNNEVYSLFASSVIPRIFISSGDLVIKFTYSDSPLASAEDIYRTLATI